MSLASCSPGTFNPSVFGTEILSVEAQLVTNYTASIPEAYRYVAPSVELRDVDFCNVTVSYTHPGQGDLIYVEAWLPFDDWNGRLQAIGGGGWVAGRFFLTYAGMSGALADGFATISTDSGIGNGLDATDWALVSLGNVNLYNLQNFGSLSLGEEAVIGKSLIRSFYGRAPDYSYWNGCSGGGRQGLMLAQRFPDAYDGISAAAPALYWTALGPFTQWAQQVMNERGHYPFPCELDALTDAAIDECDELDGVVDGVIGYAKDCLARFDPYAHIGRSIQCAQTNGTSVTISETAAVVVEASFLGITTGDGKQIYHGVAPGSDLTGNRPTSHGQPGLAATSCTPEGCVGNPSVLGAQWLQLFVAKDPDFDPSNLTRPEFDSLVQQSLKEYTSLLDSTDPDLSTFKKLGGKMVTFHGLADNIIPSAATEQYYNAVSDHVDDVQSFYRYFEAPGLGHCFGGVTGQPTHLFRQLQDWVENGKAPDITRVKVRLPNDEVHDRILCPYPAEPRLHICGDPALAECWVCESHCDRRETEL